MEQETRAYAIAWRQVGETFGLRFLVSDVLTEEEIKKSDPLPRYIFQEAQAHALAAKLAAFPRVGLVRVQPARITRRKKGAIPTL